MLACPTAPVPSGMEKASEPQPSNRSGERPRRGGVRAKLTIDEERMLAADAQPGSRFKGYAGFLVQDLMIRPHVTHFQRECWRTPDGKTGMAPLPPGVDGHFGPELRHFVLGQYHQGQVTAARLVALLRGFGVVISKRQVVRLLIAGKQSFLDEARAVLRAGLTDAALDHRRRHRGALQSQERLLHPDRQRAVCLVREHRFKEHNRRYPNSATLLKPCSDSCAKPCRGGSTSSR